VDIVPAVAKVFSPTSLVDLAHRDRKRQKAADSAALAAAEKGSPDLGAARMYAAARKARTIRAVADAEHPIPTHARVEKPTRRQQRGQAQWHPY
jgi:hypothetical protein